MALTSFKTLLLALHGFPDHAKKTVFPVAHTLMTSTALIYVAKQSALLQSMQTCLRAVNSRCPSISADVRSQNPLVGESFCVPAAPDRHQHGFPMRLVDMCIACMSSNLSLLKVLISKDKSSSALDYIDLLYNFLNSLSPLNLALASNQDDLSTHKEHCDFLAFLISEDSRQLLCLRPEAVTKDRLEIDSFMLTSLGWAIQKACYSFDFLLFMYESGARLHARDFVVLQQNSGTNRTLLALENEIKAKNKL